MPHKWVLLGPSDTRQVVDEFIAVNQLSTTHTPHTPNTELRLGRIPSQSLLPPSKQYSKKKLQTRLSTGLSYLHKTVAGWMGSEEAWWLGPEGSSSEGLEQLSVGPPPPPTTMTHDPHLLPGAWGLGLLCWPAEVQLDLGCSRLDPGEASSRPLPVAVVALPPLSSAGRHCCWERAGAGKWLSRKSPTLRASVAVVCCHTPHTWLLLGPSDTRHRL